MVMTVSMLRLIPKMMVMRMDVFFLPRTEDVARPAGPNACSSVAHCSLLLCARTWKRGRPRTSGLSTILRAAMNLWKSCAGEARHHLGRIRG